MALLFWAALLFVIDEAVVMLTFSERRPALGVYLSKMGAGHHPK
jgi:hypothetical protein